MAAELVRKAWLDLTYRGMQVGDFCTGFIYTDQAQDSLDHIDVKLEDRDGVWQGVWWPQKMDRVEASIWTQDWESPGEMQRMFCGSFEIDEPALDGPPDVVHIQGNSGKTSKNNRTQKKDCAWDDVRLSTLAAEIAARMGFKLRWEGNDRHYERVEQRHEGDLAFLERLGRETGNGVKPVNDQLFVFAGLTLDSRPPSFTLKRSQALGQTPLITHYRFFLQSHETFYRCIVFWYDLEKQITYKGKATDPDKPTGEVYFVNTRRVVSDADAQVLATSLLRDKNKGEKRAQFSLMGNVGLRAGFTCLVKEFGGFSGKYFIEKATHKLDAKGGYTCTLDLRKVLGY